MRRAFGICVIGLAAIILAAGPAAAAPASNTQTVPVTSGSFDLGGFVIPGPIPLPAPLPVVVSDLTITASAAWSGDIQTTVAWDGDQVRQGSSIDVTRSSPSTDGKIDVTWTVSGKVDGAGFGPTTVSKDDVACTPALSGGGFACTGRSGGLLLPGAIPSPIPFTLIEAQLAIDVSFDVTPTGAIVGRDFTIGGTSIPGPTANPGTIGLSDSPSTETFTVPCGAKAGDAVAYALGGYHWTPTTAAAQQTVIRIINSVPFGTDEAFQYGSDIDVGPETDTAPAFDLAGSGFLTSLGPLLANDVDPTIAPFGAFSGTEGTPIAFSAGVSSQCPIASYVWQFSNGTTSFGPSPQRTFADNGVYDGQLTVTDVTGLTATRSFTVDVANAAPTVNAGPDTTADWGRLVAFNGQAVDPGSADQSTLQYTWTFGDGTPSASGGPDVLHAYSAPGDYVAALQVCDKDGGCASSSRTVHVTKRDTTLGYTGPLSSSPSKTVTFTASLVDEYGQAVAGRKVTFKVGSQTATGTTDAAGKATVSFKLTQKGSLPLTVTFPAGDAKYNASADSATFQVGR